MANTTTDIERYQQPDDDPPEPTSEMVELTVDRDPYVGIAASPFSAEAGEILLAPLNEEDVEIRPDGLIYLPEIKYRRILNKAFGPGGWAIMPRGIQLNDLEKLLFYRGALYAHGRFVSEAIGENRYHPENGRSSYAMSAEAAKSNCLMRCCKDLGIASELWDPAYVKRWVSTHALQVWCVNKDGKKKLLWRRKSDPPIDQWLWKEPGVGTREVAEPSGHEEWGKQFDTPAPSTSADAPAPMHKQTADPPQQDARRISDKQVTRYRAIARVHGWSPEEQRRLLAAYHITDSDPGKITRDRYSAICYGLEDERRLESIRREIEQETRADDVLNELTAGDTES